MNSRTIFFLFSFLLCNIIKTFGQEFPQLMFDHITAKDGLSSNTVTSIAEDKSGFIWIGTTNGLNRFDGYRYKQYYHSNTDSNSLINNSIQLLYFDRNGRLWITTSDGVCCFIVSQNRFVNFNSKLKAPHRLNNNSSVRLYEDEKGTIWLCNQFDVIYSVNEKLELVETKINLPSFLFYGQSKTGYDNVFRDKKGNEWGFKANRIYLINKQTKQPVKEFHFAQEENVSQIQKIYQDAEGSYWVISWGGGVHQFFPEENKLKQVKSLPKRIIIDVTEWNYKGKKYLAFLEANWGLYLLNKPTLNAVRYSYISGDLFSLTGNNFNSFFADKEGNLWVNSNEGVSRVTTEQTFFDIVPVTDPGKNNFDKSTISSIFSYYETDSSIWLSKRFLSTSEYDKNFKIKNFFRSLYPLSPVHAHVNGSAYYFFKKENELFISTDSGLIIYNLLKKTSQEYFPEGKFLLGVGFRTIVQLDNDNILIRSYQLGLFVFNTVSKKFTKHYTNVEKCNTCLPVSLNYLFKTKKGEIFVSTGGESKGLFKYDAAQDKFAPAKPANDETSSMYINDLVGMDEDAEGNIWITSPSDIFIFNPATNSVIKKISNSQVTGLFRICFDSYGNAWVNHNAGISCYIPSTGKWIHFNNQDNLTGSDFQGIITKSKNGDIVAGLEGAIAIFHPDKIFNNKAEPPVFITEASVGDESFSYIDGSNQKQLKLSPGKNSFTIDFAVLNYMNPSSGKYYYMLEPLMKHFEQNDNGHINFNGLNPGVYFLHVKGGDKAGNLFSKEDFIKIIVEPKWHQTNWFKVVLAICIASCLFFFVRWRINSVKKQALLKQKMAETEMQSLRAQMNPHFIFNSLNSIENFIMQNEKRLASDYLNKFARLIRMILDSSRNEVVPVAKDMEALQLYIDLEQLRFGNKFNYKTYVEQVLFNGDYRVPSLVVQPYVENAIVHGLAHSEKKDLNLTVTVVLENNKIKYTIQDNGVGRKQSDHYNKQNKLRHKSVGLKITEERINIYNKEPGKNAIHITDLYDNENNPDGTKVEITLNAF